MSDPHNEKATIDQRDLISTKLDVALKEIERLRFDPLNEEHNTHPYIDVNHPLRQSGVAAADMFYRGSPSSRMAFNHGVKWTLDRLPDFQGRYETAIAERDLLTAEVERLRKAAEPFSVMAREMFARGWDASNAALELYKPDCRVTAGDFFEVRRALTPSSHGAGG